MRTLLILALAAALTACGTTTNILKLNHAAVRSPTEARLVQILHSEPAAPYSTIAIVEVSDRGLDLASGTLEAAIAQEAAKVGGNAVIVGPERQKTQTGISLYGDMYLGSSYSRTLLVGKVISLETPEQD
jgi:hypothetical protein